MAPVTLQTLGAAQDVRVALLDSGVDAIHPDVRRQLRGFKSFVNDGIAYHDPSGHGTHCAGILAHVAPACSLYVGKVLRDRPTDFAP